MRAAARECVFRAIRQAHGVRFDIEASHPRLLAAALAEFPGACATAAAACLNGLSPVDTPIRLRLLGGDLTIRVAGDYSTVFMTGPAHHVYDATLDVAAVVANRRK